MLKKEIAKGASCLACLFSRGAYVPTRAENWEVKGKFPTGLKPLLAQVALKAIILGEYNDNFFNLMPKIFPYNRFTMTVRVSSFTRCVVEIEMLTRPCRNSSSARYGANTRTFYKIGRRSC